MPPNCNSSSVKEINAILNKQSTSSNQDINPFKGRTLARSSKQRLQENACEGETSVALPTYANISVQYDYLDPNPASKPVDEESKRNYIPKGKNVLPRTPLRQISVEKGKTSPLILTAVEESLKSRFAIVEKKASENQIPKGNVLPRTPPQQRRTSLEMVLPSNDDDIFRRQVRPPQALITSNYRDDRRGKNRVDLEYQKRISNASHKVDTGDHSRKPKPIKPKRKKTANKGIQVSLLHEKPDISKTRQRLPQIEAASKKSQPIHPKPAQRSTSVQSVDDNTVEEFVLEMVTIY